MTDIGAINALLTSLKTATDIAKAIKSVEVSLERAELNRCLCGLEARAGIQGDEIPGLRSLRSLTPGAIISRRFATR